MTWDPANPPIRGGSYSRFIVQRQQTLPKATRGILAVPFTHDWGPSKTFVDMGGLADFVNVFGQGGVPATPTYTPGFIAVYNAFKGGGASDPGAARVIGYRFDNGGVRATVTISNTTPVPAIRLRAVYTGSQGNNISWSVQVNVDGTKHDFVIYRFNTEVERFTYLKTDLASLGAMMNATNGTGSDWVDVDGPTGGAIITGVALAPTAKTALTTGTDGSAIVAQDWTDMRTAFEAQQFEVMAPFDLTDTTISTAMATWAIAKNTGSVPGSRTKRLMLGLGGLPAETASTAVTRALAANSPDVFTLGVGTYHDSALGIDLSTSQLIPRIAGIVARRGFTASVFCTHLDDLSIVVGPSDADVLASIAGGVINLTLDSIGVRVESGITTYTSDTVDLPKATYGVLKYVFTMESFERDAQTAQEGGGILGKLNVNEDTRETVVGNAQALLDTVYIPQGGVRPGAKVVLSASPPPDDSQDFVAIDWIAAFARGLNQVRNTFYVS